MQAVPYEIELYKIGDYVKLGSGENDLWKIIRIERCVNTRGINYPYYHLLNLVDTKRICQEFNNTIFEKDEAAQLLYGET